MKDKHNQNTKDRQRIQQQTHKQQHRTLNPRPILHAKN